MHAAASAKEIEIENRVASSPGRYIPKKSAKLWFTTCKLNLLDADGLILGSNDAFNFGRILLVKYAWPSKSCVQNCCYTLISYLLATSRYHRRRRLVL